MSLDLRGTTSWEEIVDTVRQAAATAKPGQWIVLSQVFITRLREQRYPTRRELDEVAPRNPVAFRTGPDASLNSAALEISGIDTKFRVPDGEPCRVERVSSTPHKAGAGGNTWLRVTLTEGRTRQIRRMFEMIGHPVSKLKRVAIGPIRDAALTPGAYRKLADAEVAALRQLSRPS